MSRRKQARPRHWEDEIDGPGSVLDKDQKEEISVISEKSTLLTESHDSTALQTFPNINGEPSNPTTPQPQNEDAHVCGKCRGEFLLLNDFLAHKKLCCGRKRSLVVYGDDQATPADPTSISNELASQLYTEIETDKLEAVSQDGGSDGEQNFEHLASLEEEEEDLMTVEGQADLEDQTSECDYDEMEDDLKSGTLEDCEEEDTYKEEEEMLEKKLKGDLSGQLPPYMLPLATLLPGGTPNSNVMLEPLEATKAAVAQFAENNLPSTDMAVLHSTLYNLQQQQIMQLQLIQQLQQQLAATTQMQNGQLPAGVPTPQTPVGPQPPTNPQASAVSEEAVKIPQSKTSPLQAIDLAEKDKEPVAKPPVTSSYVKEMDNSSSIATATPTSSSASTTASSSSHRSSSNSHSSGGGTGPLMDFSRTQKLLDRNQYVSDDPFFKHKCRLCHKVFGSDSALQIHVRSHTGEKPFKCNICGGRFSTRGNLKVHFQRHKAEFPDVEMNPNPVPEYLDKVPMPPIAAPFPPSTITPFSTAPSFMGLHNMMNGLMFPPPHLAPRPMSASHLPPTTHLPPVKPSAAPEEKQSSSSPSTKAPVQPKKEPSPSPSSVEAPPRSSPADVKPIPKAPASVPSSMSFPGPHHLSHSSPMLPMSSIPLVSNYPAMSPLPSRPPFTPHKGPGGPATSQHGGDPFKNSILPASILDNDENLEQFMEIDKSETSKLQQLVDNIEHKLTDPNQCVICHRVLSCKSALQMHYRIHTGERPFKCKICGRAFTTKGNLKTHMGVHRAKPPLRMMHQCPVCHKQFTNLLVLQQHIRSHTGMNNLPTVPSLTHLNMYGKPHHEGHQSKPLNMSRPSPDFDRELDLSKKRRLDIEGNSAAVKMETQDDREEENIEATDDPMDEDIDEDLDDLNRMDEEANNFAAEELNRHGDESETSADGLSPAGKSREEQGDMGLEGEKDERPTSSQSMDRLSFRDIPRRSPSPKYLQEAPSPQTSQDGCYNNSYSTSLAALEERVRAIDSSMARNPLSQFHTAPFLLGPDGMMNGERSLSPRSRPPSESGSEGAFREDGSTKPPTPALSSSGEGSTGSNFMLGALDLRPQDGLSKTTTTCNICFKTFACRSALDIHYRSHTKERPYKCELCDRAFTTRGNMKQHMLTHKIRDMSGGESYDESNNNNSCTPNQNENSNAESSEDDSSHYEEPEARKELPSSDEKPIRSAVSTSPPASTVTSASTSKSSSSSSAASSKDSSPFLQTTPTLKHQCMVCQKGFSSASALQIHIRTHTGDKPFKCTVCGKAFTTKGNLKVHMGTHMWNNSPSRRGRRMSIEPPFMLAHKDNPYMTPGFPPRPDFYPFQFPPFMNGLPTPPKSLNEISVIQGLSNGMGHGGHGPKSDMTSPRSDRGNGSKSVSPDSHEDRQKFATESGELDLSMKSTGSSGSRDSKTSPSSVESSSSQGMLSPGSQSTPLGWGWKASCHLCSRSFPTPAALDHHVRTMHMISEAHKVAAS